MNTNEIRNITTNFSNLQGLKSLPIGVYFLLLAAINLGWLGGSKSLAFPLAFLGVALALFFAIQRHYDRIYGRVVSTRRSRRRDFWLVAISVTVILLAMILDSILFYLADLRYSLQSLAWGLFFLAFAGYVKRGHYAIYGVIFLALSFLPLLGVVDKAYLFDYQAGVLGFALLGLALAVGGLVDHIYILRNLPPAPRPAQEVNDGASI